MQALALPHWVWTVTITAVCGAAVWKGGPSERVGAVIFYVAWLATRLLRDSSHRMDPQWGTLWIDAILFILLAALALRSHRYWPIAAAGFELLTVVTHAARIADPTVGAWAYFTAGRLWGYVTLSALAVGVWNRWRERDQFAIADAPRAPPGATRR